jgi:preprotein translocase SecE subunit
MATERPRRGSDSDAEELGAEDLGTDDLGAEDRVRDDDYERDFGASEPPDPLGQAMPDVTEAHLAESGAPPRRPRSPRDGDGGDGGGDSGRGGSAQPAPATPRKGLFGRTGDFLRASWQELRRVQWPDRRQVGQGTAVTLGFVIVAGLYLGLLDAIWKPVIQAIL